MEVRPTLLTVLRSFMEQLLDDCVFIHAQVPDLPSDFLKIPRKSQGVQEFLCTYTREKDIPDAPGKWLNVTKCIKNRMMDPRVPRFLNQ
jgi:hypothetical protein